jgi:ParB/RepB/Spo0J family partition protein
MAAPKQIGNVIEVATERIRPDPDQPRKYFDLQALKRLEKSIRSVGQRTPAPVQAIEDDPDHEYQLIDGERRWTCCMALNRRMKVVVEPAMDADERFVASVVANFSREDHTPLEIAAAIKRIRGSAELQKVSEHAEQNRIIADKFGHSVSWLHEYDALNDLIPEVQKLMDPAIVGSLHTLTHRAAAMISHLAPERQVQVADEIRRRQLNRDQAAVFVRRVVAEHGRSSVDRKIRTQDARVVLTALGKMLDLLTESGTDWGKAFAGKSTADVDFVLIKAAELVEALEDFRIAIGRPSHLAEVRANVQLAQQHRPDADAVPSTLLQETQAAEDTRDTKGQAAAEYETPESVPITHQMESGPPAPTSTIGADPAVCAICRKPLDFANCQEKRCPGREGLGAAAGSGVGGPGRPKKPVSKQGSKSRPVPTLKWSAALNRMVLTNPDGSIVKEKDGPANDFRPHRDGLR